jgi:hypothetical protein
MWEKLDECTTEIGIGEVKRDEDKKKFFIFNEETGVKAKVKFYFSHDENLLKVSFVKKQGDLLKFYAMLKDMQTYLDEFLVSSLA